MAQTPLGKYLANWRALRNLNQGQLAHAADVTASTVLRIEAGTIQDPRISTVVKLAKALGLDDQARLTMLDHAREPKP